MHAKAQVRSFPEVGTAPRRRYVALTLYAVVVGVWTAFFTLSGAWFIGIPAALVLAAIGAFAWRRPFEGGVLLGVIGIALAIFWFYVGVVAMPNPLDESLRRALIPELLIALPPVVSGAILLSEKR